jgi:putative FmdB family regulatory protein
MPIYEYICVDCQNRFEALRSLRDADAPIACQNCQSDHTLRAISVFYAHSDGRSVTQSVPSCSTCSSGACATCGH